WGHDGEGRQVWEAYFGVDGKPVRASSGAHKWTREWTPGGDEKALAYWDEKEAPANGPEGYHRRAQVYDDRGRLVEVAYRAGAGRLGVRKGLDQGRLVYIYSEKTGRRISRRLHDAKDRRIEYTTLGANGRPVNGSNGYATTRWLHDARGRVIDTPAFDA